MINNTKKDWQLYTLCIAKRLIVFMYPTDDDIKEYLNKWLESLEETIVQQQCVNDIKNVSLDSLEDTIIRKQTNKDFVDPAHNCSHIRHCNPGATSGNVQSIAYPVVRNK